MQYNQRKLNKLYLSGFVAPTANQLQGLTIMQQRVC